MSSSIAINIKGREWKFIVVTDKTFDKRYNPDGDAGCAITIPEDKIVFIKKSFIHLTVIRHEIMHILVFSSLVESSSLTALQVEELCCEIIGEHGPEIQLWAETVMNFFTRS